MRDETVELDEAAFIEQHVEPLARRKLPLVVLGLDARRAAAQLRFGTAPIEQLQFLSHGHGRESNRATNTLLSAINHQPTAESQTGRPREESVPPVVADG